MIETIDQKVTVYSLWNFNNDSTLSSMQYANVTSNLILPKRLYSVLRLVAMWNLFYNKGSKNDYCCQNEDQKKFRSRSCILFQ